LPKRDEDYESAIDRCLIEIEHTRRDMAESQNRIERLRSETSEMLSQTRQMLSQLAL
jgi:hypothetical protein